LSKNPLFHIVNIEMWVLLHFIKLNITISLQVL